MWALNPTKPLVSLHTRPFHQHACVHPRGSVNGDGTIDALVLRQPNCNPSCRTDYIDGLTLYLNRGDATFTITNETIPDLGEARLYWHSVILVDVDGDGDLDAIIGARGSASDNFAAAPGVLLLNDGAGVFSVGNGGADFHAVRTTMSIAAADIDADGDIDLVIACGGRISGLDRCYLHLLDTPSLTYTSPC